MSKQLYWCLIQAVLSLGDKSYLRHQNIRSIELTLIHSLSGTEIGPIIHWGAHYSVNRLYKSLDSDLLEKSDLILPSISTTHMILPCLIIRQSHPSPHQFEKGLTRHVVLTAFSRHFLLFNWA